MNPVQAKIYGREMLNLLESLYGYTITLMRPNSNRFSLLVNHSYKISLLCFLCSFKLVSL